MHPRPRDIGFAIAAGAALAAYNNVINRHPWHHRRYVLLNLSATGAALSAAAASGLTAADLGFSRLTWRDGRLGAGLTAGVAAGWLLLAVVPAARPVLHDKRITSLNQRAIAYQALIRIPIGTVLWEETAFRGVLQAALRRTMPESAAIMVTGGVFGVWHVRPTLEALRANGLAVDRKQTVARVFAGSAAMAAAGVLLSKLRARSGSLIGPVLLHLATNCGGLVTAWTVASPERRRQVKASGRSCRGRDPWRAGRTLHGPASAGRSRRSALPTPRQR
jgi:uncharacterized protein